MQRFSQQESAAGIDATAIAAFCEVVFGGLEGLVPVRLLAEAGTPVQKPHLLFPPTNRIARALAETAGQAAADRRGVFVVPGTVRTAGSAKASDIAQTAVILVDIDQGDIAAKREHLIAHIGLATLEVLSGGTTAEGQRKLHLYWRLTGPASGAELTRVADLRYSLAGKIGADLSFGSIHQPIRVPGTIHGKNGVRNAVTLAARTAFEYDLDAIAAMIEAMPAMAGVAAGKKASGPTPRRLKTSPIRSEGRDEITRFEAMSRVIGHWLRNARHGICDLAEARKAVLEHNQAMIRPPWEEGQVLAWFDALLREDELHHRASAAAVNPDPPLLSDDALAASFVARDGAQFRHVPAWGQWFHWSGRNWERDETWGVRERVRQTCRLAAGQAGNTAMAARTASDKTIAAILRIAAADPRIATRTSDWDAHPMLLNTSAGIVDLATGQLRAHDPELLMTQITNAAPGLGCPLWLAFLQEITGDDPELAAYLARLAGYCLTGSTREQAFFFLHGQGANGKSVFLGVIAQVLGPYAATATLDTFMASRSERHLTELAGLRAARLVLVPETEPGRAWAEARIKSVTGGEVIRANYMHRDHFEFRPQFKLVVAGNHRPVLTGTGEAMLRRLHLIPFAVTIPPERRDPRLVERLLTERDGILGWMIKGCLEWQTIGLKPPPMVTEAAEAYLAAEDLVGQWIAETCVVGPEHRARSSDLFTSWKAWAEARGYPAGSTRALGETLRSRGFVDAKVAGARGWIRIAPRVPSAERGQP